MTTGATFQFNAFITRTSDDLKDFDTGEYGSAQWLEKVYDTHIFNGIGAEDDVSYFEWITELQYDTSFNPYDAIDNYLPDLEIGPMHDLTNAQNNLSFTALTAQSDYDFFSYTYYDLDGDASNNWDGDFDFTDNWNNDDTVVTINEENGFTYENVVDVDTIYDKADVVNWTEDNKCYYYQTLSREIEDLKEFTLTDQEMIDIKMEIDTINKSMLPVFQERIKSLEAEYQAILREYSEAADPIKGHTPDTNYDTADINGVGDGQIYDIDTLKYNDNDTYYNNTIFGTEEDRTDGMFYQYFIAKRSAKDITFEQFVAQTFTDWKSKEALNPENDDYDPDDYEGLEDQGSYKLDQIDIFTEHYIFDEMMALYEEYENLSNRANSLQMSLEVAAKYSVEFEYRKDMADKIWENLNDTSKDYLAKEKSIIKSTFRGNGFGPSASNNVIPPEPEFYGFYGNSTQIGEDEIQTNHMTKNGGLVDPYQFTLNGVEYMMGIDQNGDGTLDSISEVLGISDDIENPFESLVALDSNQDGFVSQEELFNSNIIFNAVKSDGQLANSTLNSQLIKGIDLYSLQKADDPDGKLAGTFEVKTANGKTVQGSQTFEDQAYFNNLFGTLVDLSPYKGSEAVVNDADKTVDESEEVEEAEEKQEEVTSSSSYYNKLMADLDRLNSDDSEVSTEESLLEQICWETDTILTSAQKIRILESVDNDSDIDELEAEIRNQIENLNLSA